MEAPIEETGAIDNFPINAKEGNLKPSAEESASVNDGDGVDVPDLLHPDDDSSMSHSEHEDAEDDLDFPDDLDLPNDKADEDISPQPLSDPSSQPWWSTHVQKSISRYAYHTRQYDWANSATLDNIELCLACASEAILSYPIKGGDAHSWEPAPRTIRDILKLPEGPVKHEWLKSVKKELNAEFCGELVRLLKSMYGTTLGGKY